jgi:hypothetical protein
VQRNGKSEMFLSKLIEVAYRAKVLLNSVSLLADHEQIIFGTVVDVSVIIFDINTSKLCILKLHSKKTSHNFLDSWVEHFVV